MLRASSLDVIKFDTFRSNVDINSLNTNEQLFARQSLGINVTLRYSNRAVACDRVSIYASKAEPDDITLLRHTPYGLQSIYRHQLSVRIYTWSNTCRIKLLVIPAPMFISLLDSRDIRAKPEGDRYIHTDRRKCRSRA